MEQDNYPERIVPKPEWRDNILVRDILNLTQSAVIGRRIEGEKVDSIDSSLGDDNATLKENILPVHSIPNLSTNLMGCCFEIEDFVYIQNNKGKEKWIEGDNVLDILLDDRNFTHCHNTFFIVGWYIKELEGKHFPYVRKFNQKKDYDDFMCRVNEFYAEMFVEEYEKICTDTNGYKKVDAECELRINHNPTNLNYWHFTIDLYPMDSMDHPIQKTKNSWMRLMAENVRDYLRHTFSLIPDELEPQTIKGWEELVMHD